MGFFCAKNRLRALPNLKNALLDPKLAYFCEKCKKIQCKNRLIHGQGSIFRAWKCAQTISRIEKPPTAKPPFYDN
jgi:hypothetical protein